MVIRVLPALVLALASLAPAGAPQSVTPAMFVPPDVELYVEVDRPVEVLEKLLASPIVAALTLLDEGADPEDNEELQNLRNVLKALEPALRGRVGFGLKGRLLGGPAFLVVAPRGKLDLRRAAALLGKAVAQELPDSPESRTKSGAVWRTLGGLGALAATPTHLVWSNDKGTLKDALRATAGERLGDTAVYQGLAHRQDQVLALGHVSKLIPKDEVDKADDFLGVLVAQPFLDDVRQARRAVLAGRITPWPDVRVRFERSDENVAEWSRARRAYLPWKLDGETLARFRIDRDLAAFWKDRRSLVPDGAQQGLAEFTQAMGIFFSGVPFDEVMSKLEPGFDLVVAKNRPVRAEAPEARLPAFATVFETDFDEEMRDRFKVAFQTAIGIVNADGAQNRRQPMLQFSRDFGGVEALGARFMKDPRTGTANLEYNFSPSMAFVDKRLILSSSMSLVEDLVPTLKKAALAAPKAAADAVGDLVDINIRPGVDMLRENLEVLTEERVLDKGGDFDAASAEIGAMIREIEKIGRLVLTHTHKGRTSDWRLTVTGARP